MHLKLYYTQSIRLKSPRSPIFYLLRIVARFCGIDTFYFRDIKKYEKNLAAYTALEKLKPQGKGEKEMDQARWKRKERDQTHRSSLHARVFIFPAILWTHGVGAYSRRRRGAR